MKTQKILLSCLIILSMGFTATFGNETKSLVSARSELFNELNYVLNDVPFEEYIGNVDVCSMTIIFKVNENAELTEYVIKSDNESLNEITERILNRSELKTDPSLTGIKFRLEVSFINEGYRF